MNPSSEPASGTSSFTDLLDEIATSLDHIAAVADLIRLVRTDQDLELLRVETLARVGSLIDAEVAHVQSLVRELPATRQNSQS